MSRIGKQPVVLPKGVTAKLEGTKLSVKGPKGELSLVVNPTMKVHVEAEAITVAKPEATDKTIRAMYGTERALIENLVKGVTTGFSKKLELVGVGYKAEVKGTKLQLALGYSHPIIFMWPAEIKIEVPIPTNITISGNDKQLVGQVAAKIRSFRPPEPYKGKGVKYEGEYIRRKEGKAAGK